MGKIIIQEETTKNPISLIGKEAGICTGADVENPEKNYKRGISCIESGHGKTFEFPQVYLTLDGYSARVIREFYTHCSGMPTKLQESTRYIDFTRGKFDYVTPPSVENKPEAKVLYDKCMLDILSTLTGLEQMGIKREDAAMVLPLGMKTKIVYRTNLRALIDMAHQRLCSRAYWEYRQLMQDIIHELSQYSEEWSFLVQKMRVFRPKCEEYGFCIEKNTCGRKPAVQRDKTT